MRTFLALVAVLGLFLSTATATATATGVAQGGYIYTVSHLHRFQVAGGGFSNVEGGRPSLEATADALFLSSLFGIRDRINQHDVPRYLQALENGDYGYGKSAGMASDLESVRQAVLSYQHLGLAVPNAGNVASFVKSLYDPRTNLFASRVGERGDLKSTALAFQTLEYLGELQRQWVQDTFEKIRKYLSDHASMSAEGAFFNFPNEKAFSQTSANYYGVVLGSYVSYPFGSFSMWADFIKSLQGEEGGFYTGTDKQTRTLESIAHAIATLRLLEHNKANTEQFMDLVDGNALIELVVSIPRDLHSAALAHLAVAYTGAFSRNFETQLRYELLRASGSTEKKIVQGTHFKPLLTIKTFDGSSHPGLNVEATITYEATKEVHKAKLQLTDGHYATNEFFETANHLGGLTFHYVVRCYVVGVGELGFEITDAKKVGYGMAIDAKAHSDVASKDFAPGEIVAVGTAFKFTVALHNQTHNNLHKGDFTVRFSVLDSSLVTIYSEEQDAQKEEENTTPFSFAYTLKSTNLPSGDLIFRFDIESDDGVVHTTEVVKYQLSIPMIATQISFEGVTGAPTYKIGDTVKVSIEPASYPDLRSVTSYSTKDFNGQPAAAKRQFVMDVHSRRGVHLRSVGAQVQPTETAAKYLFEVPVTPTLDSIGFNVISFRYVTASGASVPLASYDSHFGELMEDSTSLNYTVSAQLLMVDVREQPKAKTFAYGQVAKFRFRVKDDLSGHYVDQDKQARALVFLSLKHADEARGRPFVSANEPAKQIVNAQGVKEFVIEWTINPNAVQGAGALSLSIQDADGNSVDLLDESTKKPVQLEVTVGGTINVNQTTYSTSDPSYRETAFIIQFHLYCQNTSLRNAQLRASVYKDDKLLASLLPVATNEDGLYSISWGSPHSSASSGQYKAKFFREVDRKRALDAYEFQEKRRKREEALKQLEAGVENVEQETKEEFVIEDIVSPLFEISHSHVAPSTSKLPIRAEVVLTGVLIAVFLAISYQKKHYIASK